MPQRRFQGSFEEPSSKGYYSFAHKRRFTLYAGLLGVGFFILQFLLPMLAMMAVFVETANNFEDMHHTDASSMTSWQGSLWYLERPAGSTMQGLTRLMRLDTKRGEDASVAAEFPSDQAWLLPDNDRLWIISPSLVRSYERGAIFEFQGVSALGSISRPFFHDGKPAVIESSLSGKKLQVLLDGQWNKAADLTWLDKEKNRGLSDWLRILTDGDAVHLFWHYGDKLYYSAGPLEDPTDTWIPFQTVKPYDSWAVALVDGVPLVVFEQDNDKGNDSVTVLALRGEEWQPLLSRDKAGVNGLGLAPLEGTERYVLAMRSFLDSVTTWVCKGDGIEQELEAGSGFPFGEDSFPVLFLASYVFNFLAPFGLALALTFLMPRFRVPDFEIGEYAIPYASLLKRALAELVDVLIIILGFAVWMVFFFGGIFDMQQIIDEQGSAAALTIISLVFGGMGVALVLFTVIAIIEGKTGGTPGKWLFGLRVLRQDTLEPCGIGRGLIRNLLRFVDGFFNYMVGILLVAFTEKWQRLGDLAANTVVLDLRKMSAEPYEFEEE